MPTTITCNQCQNQIEITEAIRAELETKALAETQTKHQQEITLLKQKQADAIKAKEQELEQTKQQITESARKQAIAKVRQEYDVKIQSTQEEAEERQKQNQALQEQIKELLKQTRELKDAKGKLEIEYEKKLLNEQDKIKHQAKQEAQEELGLKIAEKEKKLQDAEKQILELQRKIQQGSQQLQGEVLELNFEQLLRNNFPHDTIEPIDKGVKGADVRQIVTSPKGTVCGVILWETKRTKAWSDAWIDKLKQDLRAESANIPVIVSTVLPKEFDQDMDIKDGVWITSFSLAIPLARLLRKNLLDVGYQKAVSAHQGEKADRLYEYITSHQFRQQVEAMLEVYMQMKTQITKERVAYEKMWQTREKQVDRLFSSTANIYGSIQGEVGSSALPIKGLDLPELEDGQPQKSPTQLPL